MVNTGKEQAFKKNALAALKEKFPDIQFFFFQRMLKTNKVECFEQAAFSRVCFFSGGRTDNRIFYCFAACQRFLPDSAR